MTVQGELTRLVESEHRLDAELAAARATAAALVGAAREEAERLRRGLETDIAAAAVRLRASLEEEQLAVLAAIQARARSQVERFDGMPADRIAALARGVVERLVHEITS